MIVLIAPLDWGLGHATRCIPLIRALERAGHTVIPCAGGAGARLLRAEFPHLTVEELPGYAMTYTRSRALLPVWLLAQLPAFLLGAWREARAARRLARGHGARLIISDGRYGFRAKGVPAVFVTHQLDIQPPGPAWLRSVLAPLLRPLNARALRRFDELWVPDFPGALNLSGALGHPLAPLFSDAATDGTDGDAEPRIAYIRPLCRFRAVDAPWADVDGGAVAPEGDSPSEVGIPPIPFGETHAKGSGQDIAVLALISGPEPQRMLFEERLRVALSALPGTKVLVRGVPSRTMSSRDIDAIRPGELTVFDHLPGDRLAALLERAQAIVCRSGYTTMMELAGVGARGVLLVPTPGQPEQELLAVHAHACGFAAWRDQDELATADAVQAGLAEAATLPGFARLIPGTAEHQHHGAFNLADWVAQHPLLRRN